MSMRISVTETGCLDVTHAAWMPELGVQARDGRLSILEWT